MSLPDEKQRAYYLPFQKGKQFVISQAFHGSKSHNDVVNYYAVDVAMPAGEQVCAARSGQVVALYGDGVEGEQSSYVRIREANGQLNDYQHLLSGSIQVRTGDFVQTGQCFAKVGNTGHSTGPHLHFSVLTMQAGTLVSKPFVFIHADGHVSEPVYLQWLRN